MLELMTASYPNSSKVALSATSKHHPLVIPREFRNFLSCKSISVNIDMGYAERLQELSQALDFTKCGKQALPVSCLLLAKCLQRYFQLISQHFVGMPNQYKGMEAWKQWQTATLRVWAWCNDQILDIQPALSGARYRALDLGCPSRSLGCSHHDARQAPALMLTNRPAPHLALSFASWNTGRHCL